ncbi:hypothetical protein WMF27_28180 [Sorangium sp. So ce281]|uniref:hypothetical protein n=1 Tax=unclassified Sorangium TaxID=2621164 RepID=UPI003F63F6BE
MTTKKVNPPLINRGINAENVFRAPSGRTRQMTETEWLVCTRTHPMLRFLLGLGNPFRAVAFDPDWRTSTAVELAGQMYESRVFGPMPLLADALLEAGCEDADVLGHCRGDGPHVRGCWVIDSLLGKEIG